MNDNGFRRKTERSSSPNYAAVGPASIVMAVAALVIGFFMGYDEALRSQMFGLQGGNALVGTQSTSSFTTALSMTELLGHVSKERRSLITRLQTVEYGDFTHVLSDPTQLRRLFSVSEESKTRYVRRIQKKIVEKFIHPEQQVKFTWVSAGDASTEGYANQKGESYTSILDASVRPAFSAIGIDFVARSRGISGMGDTPIAALCMDTVYGSEVDVLSWDFSQIDGDQTIRTLLWTERAAVHSSRPLLFMLDSSSTERWSNMQQTETKVLGVALLDVSALEHLKFRFPDSGASANVASLPAALQYYVCDGAIEGSYRCEDETQAYMCNSRGGEKCRKHKFRAKQSCSNPAGSAVLGWKEHLLRGRIMALFVFDLLQDALLDLEDMIREHGHFTNTIQWKLIADKLSEADELDAFLLESKKSSENQFFGRYAESMSDVSNMIRTHPTECCIVGLEDQPGHDSGMSKDTSSQVQCAPTIQPFQIVQNGDDWWKLQCPTSSANADSAGLVLACFRTCTSSGCSTAMKGLDQIKLENGNIAIQVDGQSVTRSREMDGCHILEGATGVHWPIRNDGSAREVSFQVNEEDGSMQVLAVITM